MPPINAAYLEHQLKRWMRPDAHHFVRPDWRKFVRPGFEDGHPFALYERKYRPDQARVPPGSREGGQWTDEEGSGGGSEGGNDETGGDDERLPPKAKPVQFRPDERSIRSERLVQSGGEHLGSFGESASVTKGPNIAHQESFDTATGITTLSFTGVGSVVVDEKIGNAVYTSAYTVGTPARPDLGLSIRIDRTGRVRASSTFPG